ncbi:MAG: cupin domain-containing protein [Halococcoides sp.]
MTHPLIVAAESMDWTEVGPEGETFRRKQLGGATDDADLGCSLYDVPPETATWRRHFHAANAEAIYVLEGSGEIELGPEGAIETLEPGTYVALPPDERGTHRVVAGDEGVVFLAVSTMRDPDVTVYPDAEMVGLYAGAPPGGDREKRTLSTFLDADATVEYWERSADPPR